MDKIIAIVTLYEGIDLLQHFVPHYFQLGIDELYLNVNTATDHTLVKDCQLICSRWPVLITEVYHPSINDELKDQDERTVLDRNSSTEDWVLHLDLDEFHEYPFRLPTITAAMEAAEAASISTDFVDRISTDGRLRPLLPSPSIFAQFPVGCTITKDWMALPYKKVMLCRNWVRLYYGRHQALNAPVHAPVLGEWLQYRVHHFKWFQGIKEKLFYRGTLHHSLNGHYVYHCRRMADSIIDDCIKPDSVPNYEWCGDLRYPNL